MYILLFLDARLHGSNHGGRVKKTHCCFVNYLLFNAPRVLIAIKHHVQANTCLVHLHNHLSSHLQSGSRWDLRTAEEVIGWPS